jgi:hypothetical protein
MSDEQEIVKQDVVKSDSDEEESVYSGTGSGSDESSAINIDLTENNIYQGICTLFEDEEGNNILQYIGLIHTELIAMRHSLESVKDMKDDIHRIANAIETLVKAQVKSSSSSHKKSSTSDDVSVASSRREKS